MAHPERLPSFNVGLFFFHQDSGADDADKPRQIDDGDRQHGIAQAGAERGDDGDGQQYGRKRQQDIAGAHDD